MIFRWPWHTDMELDDDGHEPDDDDYSGIGDVYVAALPPCWTSNPPVREGVYHCRPVGAEGYAIVAVEELNGRLCYRPWGYQNAGWMPVPHAPHSGQAATLEWSNRSIPEPREAAA